LKLFVTCLTEVKHSKNVHCSCCCYYYLCYCYCSCYFLMIGDLRTPYLWNFLIIESFSSSPSTLWLFVILTYNLVLLYITLSCWVISISLQCFHWLCLSLMSELSVILPFSVQRLKQIAFLKTSTTASLLTKTSIFNLWNPFLKESKCYQVFISTSISYLSHWYQFYKSG
jgi:hypothetical protein